MNRLSADNLILLIKSVFPKLPDDRHLGILMDIPRKTVQDNQDWALRRTMVFDWFELLKDRFVHLDLHSIRLIAYADVGSNNAELPAEAFYLNSKPPDVAVDMDLSGQKVAFDEIFKKIQLFLAVTEYSTTAPLKIGAKKYGFRAATMPG